jgi:protein-tyrosine phosphatase
MEETCHVLFVCLGNICRSPAGENIFRHQVKESGLSDCIACDSAGTAGYHIGKSPDARMTKAMRHRGYQVTGGARQFSPDDFNRFDLILTMDDDNYRDIISQARSDDQRKRVRCFTDFCTEHDETEVPDPYYGGDEGFEFVADLIEDGSAGIIAHLRKTRGL